MSLISLKGLEAGFTILNSDTTAGDMLLILPCPLCSTSAVQGNGEICGSGLMVCTFISPCIRKRKL